jgi:hypothetical protein
MKKLLGYLLISPAIMYTLFGLVVIFIDIVKFPEILIVLMGVSVVIILFIKGMALLENKDNK